MSQSGAIRRHAEAARVHRRRSLARATEVRPRQDSAQSYWTDRPWATRMARESAVWKPACFRASRSTAEAPPDEVTLLRRRARSAHHNPTGAKACSIQRAGHYDLRLHRPAYGLAAPIPEHPALFSQGDEEAPCPEKRIRTCTDSSQQPRLLHHGPSQATARIAVKESLEPPRREHSADRAPSPRGPRSPRLRAGRRRPESPRDGLGAIYESTESEDDGETANQPGRLMAGRSAEEPAEPAPRHLEGRRPGSTGAPTGPRPRCIPRP